MPKTVKSVKTIKNEIFGETLSTFLFFGVSTLNFPAPRYRIAHGLVHSKYTNINKPFETRISFVIDTTSIYITSNTTNDTTTTID